MSIKRWIVRGVQALVVLSALLYAGDWIATRVHIAHGTAFHTVQVHKFLATALKGEKEEYDYDGDDAVTCTSSLFPQAGNPPCWWLKRHTTQWE
jgi:hypothetical protein